MRKIAAVVDDEWMADGISDDEIEIPLEIDIPQDDADIDAGEAEAAKREEERWGDLELDFFRPGNTRR